MKLSIFIHNVFKIFASKCIKTIRAKFTGERILQKNYKENTSFSFVQIGANDGISHDTLYPFLSKRNSCGIAIEPITSSFKELQINYNNLPKVKLLNIAVHASKKEVILFKVKPDKLNEMPDFASGIASIFPDHHKKTNIPAVYMEEEKAVAKSLMQILEEENIYGEIDFLQSDTEGYDIEIIRQIDFKRIKPLIIRFEHWNADVQDNNTLIRLLKRKGYYCFYDNIDIVAVNICKIWL